MRYKINPLTHDELRRLARERLVVLGAGNASSLSTLDAQRLLEDLALHRIELEIQNEYLQDTYARLKLALDRAYDLYDFAPVGCITTDAKGVITASNLVGSDMLGTARAALVNQPFDIFFSDSQRSQIHTLIALAKHTGEHQLCELALLNTHGLCQHVQLNLSSMAHGDGCQMVLTDITARKTAESRLREESERCTFAMDAVGDCQWDWDLRTGKVSYSPQLTQLYGYGVEELGESVEAWRALVHANNQTCFIQGVQKCLSGQEGRFACEIQVLCKDGSYKWILCRGAVFSRTPDGRVDRLIGIHTDITPFKTAGV